MNEKNRMNEKNSGTRGFQRVLTDIVDLCELQWQLLSVDGQEAKRRAVTGGVFVAAGGVVALASTTSAVLASGWLLHEQFALSVGVSFLITTAVALVVAMIGLLIGRGCSFVRTSRSARQNKSSSRTCGGSSPPC